MLNALAERARKEKERKSRCPEYRKAHKQALKEQNERALIRERIKGIGRNELCPTHGIKVKKCGCLIAARKKIEFDGRKY